MNNRILSVLVTLIVIFTLSVNVLAVEEDTTIMPDLTQKGSLTLTMDVDGELLNNGNLNLYRVADIVLVEENRYDFCLLDALTSIGATLDTEKLYDSTQVQELLEYAREALDQCFTQSITDGQVSFTDLDAGLYLVWQSSEDATEGYDAIAPFLISVPKWQDGVYSLHVDAKPKVPFTTEPPPPSTEPPPPPPPNLPNTGQLKWPVSVMSVGGVAFLIIGFILCATRKRRDREK